MRKKQFGKLLTVSLSENLYGLVEEIADLYDISMGEVVRNSIEYSMHYDGSWMASKKRPFTLKNDKISIDFSDYNLGDDLEDGTEESSLEVNEIYGE